MSFADLNRRTYSCIKLLFSVLRENVSDISNSYTGKLNEVDLIGCKLVIVKNIHKRIVIGVNILPSPPTGKT